MALIALLWIVGLALATAAVVVYRRSGVDRSWSRLTILLVAPATILVTLVAIANQGPALGLGAGLLFGSAMVVGSAYRWRQKVYWQETFRRKMREHPGLRERFEKRAIFRRALRSIEDDPPGDEASRTS